MKKILSTAAAVLLSAALLAAPASAACQPSACQPSACQTAGRRGKISLCVGVFDD